MARKKPVTTNPNTTYTPTANATYNSTASTGSFSSGGNLQGTNTVLSGITSGTVQINGFTYSDPVSELRAEVDELKVLLERSVANGEKLEIEARYWHIKSEALEKSLTRLIALVELSGNE